MMIIQLISMLLAVGVTSGERYTFDVTKRADVKSPSVVVDGEASLPTRMLQSDSDPCYYSADKLVCIYSFAAGPVGNETSITFMAQCDINELYKFDYRQASNCACLAQVTPAFGTMKECPCAVCAANLGETPVSVDCSVLEMTEPIATTRAENITEDDGTGTALIDDSVSIPADNTTIANPGEDVNITATNTNNTEALVDPFIFATCSSIDCFGACNGTCSLNCNDPSGNICPYCETYTGSGASTPAPTGSGDNDIGELGAPPQASPKDTTSHGVTSGLSVVAMVAILCTGLI